MPLINKPIVVLRLALPALWAVIILWLSLTSSPPQLPGVFGWDKLLHAGAYGLLSVLIAQTLFFLSNSIKHIWWQASFSSVAYGGLLEILQFFSQTGRVAEWWDLFADAVGALLCSVIFCLCVKLFFSSERDTDKTHG